jgi:hypothetical protein
MANQNFSPHGLLSRAIERRAVEAAIWGMPLINVGSTQKKAAWHSDDPLRFPVC